ncbi:MAG: hypothetical protein CEE38_02205 [Planctomycetes bacterium B3_Pla]|nr:MAG: hypothetical protein CEE38_02205 [Planctomycetes bacterium B3_Pla]
MVKKSLLVAWLFASVMCLAGCVVVVKEETWKPVGLPTDDAVAEIDAVEELSFESDRKQAYERIAAREGLSDESQVHLVEAALDRLTFDNAKEKVLLALIANPSFCGAAEQAILESLDKLAFESSRKKVLKAISDRKNRP